MARYIDVEKIKLTANTMVDDSGEVYVALSDVRKAIALAPTADVAPRAEVAREIFEEIESKLTLNKATHCGQKFYYIRLEDDIAELKNKYAEGRNER